MKVKKIAMFVGVIVLLLSASACGFLPRRGSGELVTETRAVSGFSAVDFSGLGEVEIIQDGSESITITTDDDVMPHVVTEVRGETLVVGFDFDGPIGILPTRMEVTLHVDELGSITASGAWKVHADSLEGTDLETLISGTGNLSIDQLEATDLSAEISGAGEMAIAGEVVSQNIAISGAGEYNAGDLKSESARVEISGSGETTLWVTGSLEVTVSGAGRIYYYGQPQVDFTKSGTGTLSSLGDK